MTAFRRKDIDPAKLTKLWNDRSISTAAIAERFGVYPKSIHERIKKLGLEPRTKNYEKKILSDTKILQTVKTG